MKHSLPTSPLRAIAALTLTCTLTGASLFDSPCVAQDAPVGDQPAKSTQLEDDLINKLRSGDWDTVISATDPLIETTDADSVIFRARANAFQQRGQDRFFAAEIKGSIADFDAFLELVPERDPHHWQRGISLYYADEYAKGKAQFERHQTVNTQDVENAVWHFLCAVRAPDGSVEAARKEFINIEADPRIPMKQIHALFAGEGDEQAVLEAAGEATNIEELRNGMCYAHLYLGLYHEALGDVEKAKQHIVTAATDFQMNHYMGQVAQVHAQLRDWLPGDDEATTEKPTAAAAAVLVGKEDAADATDARYTSKTPSSGGIGKVYMGREISQVVGHGAVRWLERPEREQEEAPSKVIENMELKATDVVADIGAGSGYFSFRLAKLVPEGKVLSVDIQQEMLNFIEGQKKLKKMRNVETILGTIEDTKLPEGEVDAIIMVDAYHEFSHPHEMATSMVKGLRPGGRIILIEYRGEDPEVPIKTLHKMTEQQCIREMKAVGMTHVKTLEFLPIQHFMVFQKPDE